MVDKQKENECHLHFAINLFSSAFLCGPLFFSLLSSIHSQLPTTP